MKADPKTSATNPSLSTPGQSKSDDVAVVCGLTSDGKGLSILRKRGETIEAGTVRTLEPGKPIHGDVVRLKPRKDAPLVCDIEVEMSNPNVANPSDSAPKASGPAQVANAQYRKNWDAIYKHHVAKPGRAKTKQLLN